MARPGITYDEVIAAIDALLASGEEPTIQRIREQLGTGSPNTIHRHLVTWRASRPVEQRKAPELPAELQAALVKEIERQAAEARTDVERSLVEAQKEAATLAKAGEEPIMTRPINWELISHQYDEMIKYATALKQGIANPEAILRRFTRNNIQHPTYRALSELIQKHYKELKVSFPTGGLKIEAGSLPSISSLKTKN